MNRFFFEAKEQLSPLIATGSSGDLKQGCGLSKKNRGKAPPAWVGRDTTLILGCNPDGDAQQEQSISTAEWVFPVTRRLASKAHGAVLVVACDRRQAGLHSPRFGAVARVLVNDNEVDIAGLRERPQGHDDYFHRVTHQEIPPVPVIKNSGTLYSFNVPPEFLSRDDTEKISISVDPGVRWDIDHIVLVMKHTEERIRPWLVAVIFSVLGAFIGAAANEVWKYVVAGN